MCTATQVRSLGPSQLAQGAMPALAAALRVALLGRLALASVVPIGHDGLAAAANLALRPVGARPRGSACACSTHGSDVRGGPLAWGGAARDVRQGHRQGLAWAAGGARRARQKKLRAHRLQLPRDRDVRCRARPRPRAARRGGGQITCWRVTRHFSIFRYIDQIFCFADLMYDVL